MSEPSRGSRAGWPERVERLLAEGRAWRAKEVLRGNIAAAGYDRALYRRYAELLLGLGEQLEAGKYFLLAGVVDGEAEAAVRLYRHRHRNSSGLQMYQEFPRSARVRSWQELPEAVARELREHGMESLPRSPAEVARELGQASASRLLYAGCWTFGILALVCGGVGAFVIVRWLAGLVLGEAG